MDSYDLFGSIFAIGGWEVIKFNSMLNKNSIIKFSMFYFVLKNIFHERLHSLGGSD